MTETVLSCCQDPERAAGKHPPIFTSLCSASSIYCVPLASVQPYSLFSPSPNLTSPSNTYFSSLSVINANFCCSSSVCRYIQGVVGKQALTRENVQNSNVTILGLGNNVHYSTHAIALAAPVLLKEKRREMGLAQETVHVGEYLGRT